MIMCIFCFLCQPHSPLPRRCELIKANSSKWVNENFPKEGSFAWQEGYGAFSIGKSQEKVTVSYILNQPEHHRARTFQEEFLAFLHKHEIEYDPRFVWG